MDIDELLSRVQKPARYIGREVGAVVKALPVDTRFAMCFPDTYEVGMSHLGLKILYGLLNSRDDVWCERVFAPQDDMERAMREEGVPLFGLESRDPLGGFDIIGFTLQYELCYTNVLNMLDLAGLPLRAAERTALSPLVIGGGPCVCNAEPVADFFDLFVFGEGEEVTLELIDLYQRCKREGASKADFLRRAAGIEGIYVPSLYTPRYDGGRFAGIEPQCGAPKRINRRVVSDLDNVYYPERFVVPFCEVVHDRIMLEVMRGCPRGCRFCQAGMLYRPVRRKKPDTLVRNALAIHGRTGYEEISLTSLSTSDYTELDKLIDELLCAFEGKHVSVSLPSLRADNFRPEMAARLQSVRRSGLTFAPEAGSQRLRDAIRKDVAEADLMRTCELAFDGGWSHIKLYFMLGLPTETDDDLLAIADLGRRLVELYYAGKRGPKALALTISVACFVPKPHTPFQWASQDDIAEMERKQRLLREAVRSRRISLNWHDNRTSFLEAVFARGDRRLCAVLEAAYGAGCRFDAWGEHFRFGLWEQAFMQCGVDPLDYTRERGLDEPLPWAHMDVGVGDQLLRREWRRTHNIDEGE